MGDTIVTGCILLLKQSCLALQIRGLVLLQSVLLTSTKSVAIPTTTQGRDRSKTEDLTPGFQSSAPEFRERSRTAGAKLSSNVSDLQHEVVTLRDELETLRRQLAEKDKVIKVLKPPRWRPDEDVERCTLCAMEFTFWNRRVSIV